MNKLFQQLNAGVPEQARKMAALFKGARNPQTLIANALKNNPEAAALLDTIKNGADPQALFYAKAKEKGVDPESILRQKGDTMTQKYHVQLSMNQSATVLTGMVFKQGDFGFQLEIEVMDFDNTGTTPQIVFRKNQGAVESTDLTVVGNVYTYTLKGTELDTPGIGVCDLKLKNSTTQRISTASFQFEVIADTLDGLAEETSSYSDTIAQIAENIQGYADDSEAWAVGTKQGVPITSDDPQYHNNAKYYAEEADNYIETSEAWAVGTKDGVPVTSDDPQFNNNSKYFKEESEAWAVGQKGGVDVTSDDDQYQNNSKWYSEVSQFYKEAADDDVDACQNIYDQFINTVGLGTFTYDAATGDLYYETTPGSIYTFSIVDGNLYFDTTTP